MTLETGEHSESFVDSVALNEYAGTFGDYSSARHGRCGDGHRCDNRGGDGDDYAMLL